MPDGNGPGEPRSGPQASDGELGPHRSNELAGPDEGALRQGLLEAIIDHLPVAVFVKRPEDGRFVLWNRGNAELLGISTEEALGRTDHDFFPAGQADFFRRKDLEALAAGRVIDVPEEPIDSRTRGPSILHTRKVPLYDAQGRPLFLIGISEDITERKRIEEELRASEDRYRTLIEQLGEGVGFVDPGDRFVMVNQAGAAIYGRPAEALIGRSTLAFCPPEEAEKILTQTALHGRGESSHYELDILRGDGERRTLLVTGSPRLDAGGSFEGTIAVFRDVTENRRMEREIRLLGHALRSAGECVCIADLEDRLLFVNEAFLRTYGYSREELMGRPIGMVRARGGGPPAEILPATLDGGWQGELRNRRKDGGEFPIRLTTTVVRDDEGRAVATVGVARDITEQKRAEAALDQALRAAEAASEAKSQFLANMSHEIRTPMNGILGMSGLLGETGLDPAQREMAEAIRTSAEALLSVINDILDFSRIEAGSVRIEPAPFDLRGALEDVIELLTPRAEAAGIELALWYDRRTPFRFVGDAGRIRQVFLNLAGNALKFTERGHVLVQVRALRQEEDVTGISIAIHDTGIGIAPDKLPLLFRKFSQVDGSSVRRHEGSGLGLAISKALVELMGGTLGVASRPEEGSSFTFTLPLDPAAGAGVAGPSSGELEGVRVLIAGQGELSRTNLVELCAAWGMLPVEAASIEETATILAQTAPSGDQVGVVLVHCPGAAPLREALGRTLLAAQKPVVIFGDPRNQPGQCPLSDAPWCRRVAWPVKHARLRQALADLLGSPERAAPSTTAANPACPPPAFAGRRALLVEDNAINRMVGQRLLEKLGFEVALAENGREAIAAVEGQRFDAIIMDCQMPEMDGFEATRRLRASGAARGAPILAITARAMEGDRAACLAAGMDGYLSKPIRPEDLSRMLEQLLSRAPDPPALSPRRD
jgi:two-component system sensor histidine kinase/response regulator